MNDVSDIYGAKTDYLRLFREFQRLIPETTQIDI